MFTSNNNDTIWRFRISCKQCIPNGRRTDNRRLYPTNRHSCRIHCVHSVVLFSHPSKGKKKYSFHLPTLNNIRPLTLHSTLKCRRTMDTSNLLVNHYNIRCHHNRVKMVWRMGDHSHIMLVRMIIRTILAPNIRLEGNDWFLFWYFCCNLMNEKLELISQLSFKKSLHVNVLRNKVIEFLPIQFFWNIFSSCEIYSSKMENNCEHPPTSHPKLIFATRIELKANFEPIFI